MKQFEPGKIYETELRWPELHTFKFRVIKRTKCYVWTEELTADIYKFNKSWIAKNSEGDEVTSPHGVFRRSPHICAAHLAAE